MPDVLRCHKCYAFNVGQNDAQGRSSSIRSFVYRRFTGQRRTLIPACHSERSEESNCHFECPPKFKRRKIYREVFTDHSLSKTFSPLIKVARTLVFGIASSSQFIISVSRITKSANLPASILPFSSSSKFVFLVVVRTAPRPGGRRRVFHR